MKVGFTNSVLRLLVCLGFIGPHLFAQKGDLSLHLRDVQLQRGERITGIEISLTAGCFKALRPIPAGWSVTIDNDPSWSTSLRGQIEVGAAALDRKALRALDISIRKYEYGDHKFTVSGKLEVDGDLENRREIDLTEKDFVLRSEGSTSTQRR